MAKDLFNRYLWLVDTIYRAGTITLNGINRKWLQCEMSGGEAIPLRTFHHHRQAIEKLFDINIACNRRNGCIYYIEDAEELEREGVRKWLLDTFAIGTALNGRHRLKDKILLEEYPSGRYLLPIIEAIDNCMTLDITYQGHWQDHPCTFQIEPYCLKVFGRRWYVAARSPYYNKVLVYSLDRILELEQTRNAFEYPSEFSPKAYFDGCFGVITDEEYSVETIRVKVYGNQCKYFRHLPLHHSQKESVTCDGYSVFDYELRPTYDFCQAILSHGSFVEVLEPLWLREQIKEMIRKAYQLYQ